MVTSERDNVQTRPTSRPWFPGTTDGYFRTGQRANTSNITTMVPRHNGWLLQNGTTCKHVQHHDHGSQAQRMVTSERDNVQTRPTSRPWFPGTTDGYFRTGQRANTSNITTMVPRHNGWLLQNGTTCKHVQHHDHGSQAQRMVTSERDNVQTRPTSRP